MRLRYVVSTMVFWWRETHLSFEQECEFLGSLGYGVELWPNIRGQNECRYDKRNWSRLVAATENMLVSMRSRNDGVTLEQWNEQIECAKLLDANIVADLKSLGITDGSEINSCGFTADVIKLAEDNNVRLCLETGQLPILRQVSDKFDSVWYCLDIGYANIDQKFSFKEYVDALAERIAYLHLSDNYGRIDDHEPVGLRGGISPENWDYLLSNLCEYDNDIISSFEMSPSMPSVMIRQASEFLFDGLKWPGRPKCQPACVGSNYNPA